MVHSLMGMSGRLFHAWELCFCTKKELTTGGGNSSQQKLYDDRDILFTLDGKCHARLHTI